MNRRDWLRLTATGAALALTTRRLDALPVATKVTVYKSPTCGCCKQWVTHMTKAGFAVTSNDVDDAKLQEVKDTFGVPAALRSCHVALVGLYAIEGHVPADLVKKVLRERPKLVGLAVPGMPAGSPGMEMGARKDAYDVMAFDRSGRSWAYAHR